MKLFSIITVFMSLSSLVLAGDFEKRACVASKCSCNGTPGLFCGDSSVNSACASGHVFQCNANKKTCDFGVRKSCQQCGKLGC
ncbi:hypothetical protein GGX14DRAFT_529717 [Mycena pura]|uniref:Uncharacterized protein n=1 Tax=Mycena pura TaxID=153505 RepID=A0AAD6UPP0_9AGAR|nr:hypothetical protein GGX14DRAFT_529717 [Mycena pura]